MLQTIQSINPLDVAGSQFSSGPSEVWLFLFSSLRCWVPLWLPRWPQIMEIILIWMGTRLQELVVFLQLSSSRTWADSGNSAWSSLPFPSSPTTAPTSTPSPSRSNFSLVFQRVCRDFFGKLDPHTRSFFCVPKLGIGAVSETDEKTKTSDDFF